MVSVNPIIFSTHSVIGIILLIYTPPQKDMNVPEISITVGSLKAVQ